MSILDRIAAIGRKSPQPLKVQSLASPSAPALMPVDYLVRDWFARKGWLRDAVKVTRYTRSRGGVVNASRFASVSEKLHLSLLVDFNEAPGAATVWMVDVFLTHGFLRDGRSPSEDEGVGESRAFLRAHTSSKYGREDLLARGIDPSNFEFWAYDAKETT